jgi:hypothetical protein
MVLGGDSKIVSLRKGYVLLISGFYTWQNAWHLAVFILAIYCCVTLAQYVMA